MPRASTFLMGLIIGVVVGLLIGGFGMFATCTAYDCKAIQQEWSDRQNR